MLALLGGATIVVVSRFKVKDPRDFTHCVTLKGLLSHQSEIVKASNLLYVMDAAFWLENFEGMDHLGNEGEDMR